MPKFIMFVFVSVKRLYLETRFEQLRVAADLELWVEAYKAIEVYFVHMFPLMK